MWTISNKQMGAMTESLVKKGNEIEGEGEGKEQKTTKSHVEAFIKRYEAAGNTKSNDSPVDGAFDWFQHLDFKKISWNL